MAGCELEDRGSIVGVCSISPLCKVLTGFQAHTTSYPQGTVDSVRRGKSGRIMKLVTVVTLVCWQCSLFLCFSQGLDPPFYMGVKLDVLP